MVRSGWPDAVCLLNCIILKRIIAVEKLMKWLLFFACWFRLVSEKVHFVQGVVIIGHSQMFQAYRMLGLFKNYITRRYGWTNLFFFNPVTHSPIFLDPFKDLGPLFCLHLFLGNLPLSSAIYISETIHSMNKI